MRQFMRAGALAALAFIAAGCRSATQDTTHAIKKAPVKVSSDAFVNGDFENGTLSSWTLDTYLNPGINYPPNSVTDLNLQPGGSNKSRVVTGSTESVIPAGLSAGASLRVPKYGSGSAVVNELGSGQNVNSLHQQMTTTSADVDPADGNIHIRFALAPVLQNPGHALSQQPYFYVVLKNLTKSTVLFSTFNYSNQPGVPWKTDPSTGTLYTDWQAFDVAPGPAGLAIGDSVEITVIAAGCAAGGHYGHVYLDAFGAFLPGLSVAASAPGSANAGTDLTYTFLAKNSGTAAATNSTVTFTIPANTTFTSVNAPGASCTTPAVGGTGDVVCNLGTINPAGSVTFTATVHIASGATGSVNNGNYKIQGDGVSPLIGPLVVTQITQNVSYADLAITKTDGQAAAPWGSALTYTINVTNNGPSAANGAAVTDTMPALLTGVSWTCAASNGAACNTASGTGNISDTIPTLPVGGVVRYTVSATLQSGSGNSTLTNTATVAAPSGVTDNTSSNNTAVDTDSVGTLYPLTVNKAAGNTGAGTVVSSPAAINCGPACTSAQAGFVSGTLVSLTATAASGDTFAGWSGACSGTANPCNVTVSAATSVTALFTGVTYTVNGNVSGANGTISCNSPVVHNQNATCTITPSPGYQLVTLTDNGTSVISSVSGGTYTIVNVTANHTLSATFAKSNGGSCSATSDCASGNCIDGFCCNTACNGQCEACDVAGSEGTCSPATGAPHGARTACATDGTSCGGSCDGSNRSACAYPDANTACGSASCTNGVEAHVSSCTGAGSCAPAPTASCGTYACGTTTCQTSCAGDGDCASGNYCNGGSCVPQLVMGGTCSANNQCASGNCVDGFCCNTACNGQCEACDVAGSEGTCSPVATGAPHGSRTACATDGSSCGGSCDGSSRTACGYPTTACRAASCANDTATLPAFCDGAGSCPATQTQACGQYVCGATACLGNCSSDGDCAGGNYCSGGICVAKQANGATCSGGNQCASGSCADGFCCNTACDGQCEACDATGSEGTCTAVAGAPHGARQACASDGSSCGGTCDGTTHDRCSYPTTECRAAACGNGTATIAANCDGAGSCPAIQTQACGTYVCGPSACLGNCSSDGDCTSDNYCAGGVCVAKQANGGSCSASDQCSSGNCIDGFCCNTACDGQCEACDVSGSEGTCSPVPSGAPHGARVACTTDGSTCGGSCDGSSRTACHFPAAETSCRSASCSDGTATMAAACDGAGHCPDRLTQNCGEYVCGTTACRGNCTSDGDCSAGNFCSAGICKAKLDNGAQCTGANQCGSGNCVDGLCCNTACDGQCEACDVSGSKGTCSPVTGEPHGARTACATDGSSCGGTCDGAKRTSCSYPTSQCDAPTCSGGTEHHAAICDGAGHCPVQTTKACNGYACGETACNTSCKSDADCATGFGCVEGVCEMGMTSGGTGGSGGAGANSGWTLAGSGGCQSGEGLGILALLVPALLLLRKRRTAAAMAVVTTLGIGSARAEDQSTAFTVQRFQPLGGTDDVLGLASARDGASGRWDVGLYGNWARAPLRLTSTTTSGESQLLLRNQATLDLVAGFWLSPRFELAVALPVTVSQPSPGAGTAGLGTLSSSGLGDLRVTPKVRLLELERLSLAISATASLPSGDSSAFLGTGTLSVAPRLVAEYGFGYGVRTMVNVGGVFQPKRTTINLEVGSALTFGAGAEAPFFIDRQRFAGMLTVAGESESMHGGVQLPLEALAGVRWSSPLQGLDATVAGGPGLTNGFGTPKYRFIFGVGYHPAN